MLEQILLGTYTQRSSQDVYKAALDTTQGRLTEATLLLGETGPIYLALSQKDELFNVASVDGKGGTAAYQPGMDHFNLLNKVTEEDAPPYYVAVDENRQLVYAANYHQGIVHVYRILEDGSLEDADKMIHTEPTGPHESQDNAHVHYADLTPDQRLIVCDLGADRMCTYNVSLDKELSEIARFVAGPGTGPRHLVFHPTKSLAYLFGKLDSTVSVLSYDETDGSFTGLQEASASSADCDALSGGTAIRISSDDRFLYTSNRGHNSIAVYAVSENSEAIERVQLISTEGDIPRDFDLDPSEDSIIITNQDSDNLTLYRRNQEAGLLKMIQKDVAVPECVCVLFV